MSRSIVTLTAALLSVQPVGAPAFAADGPATVKVALMDMSSMAGGWRGSGPGRGMGAGMMGRGMGSGMMGHGMAVVRTDHDTIKAGPVRFDVTNWSRDQAHEVLVVAVTNPRAPLPYDEAAGRVTEDRVKVLADTEDMPPNASRTVNLTLTPGSYLLLCNLPGHYAAGMVTTLTVTP